MEKTVILNVTYVMGPGGAEGFVKDLTDAGILAQIRAHEGCLKYDYYKALDSDDLLLVEWWTDHAALDEHQACAYMKELGAIKNKYASDNKLEKYIIG